MPAARDEDWTAIAAQAAAGATLRELSLHWNIPEGTLKDRCAREGWKRHAREIQSQRTGKEIVASHQTVQPRPTDRAVSLMSKLGSRSKLRAAKVGDSSLKALQKKKDDELLRASSSYLNTVNALAKVHGWGQEGHSTTNAIQINLSGIKFEQVE